MAFYLKAPHARELVKVIPSASTVGGTTSGQICSSDVGRLCVTSSTILTAVGAELPVFTTFAGAYSILGIVAHVPTNTTQGSSTPFYIEKIHPGDVVECDYSTDVETSTGATSSIMVTSNLGYFFGIGGVAGNNTTLLVGGMYLDGSVASTIYAASTRNTFFRLGGFTTANHKAWGTIATSNLVP